MDKDLFEPSGSDGTNGTAVANLTYRVTSLFSGMDAVLGASAGLKHFGTRRLGRSSLAVRLPHEKDNVRDNDCSGVFRGSVGGMAIHSAYFDTPAVLALMREVLRGVDRSALVTLGLTTSDAWSSPGAPVIAVG